MFDGPFGYDFGLDSLGSELGVCGVWVCLVVVDDDSVSWLEVREVGRCCGFVCEGPLVLVCLLSL